MSADEISRDVLKRLEDAWNAGDGAAFGQAYTTDACFVTVRGELHRGPEIGVGHARIFATIYAGSTNRMELIESRRVGPDAIVATSRNTLDAPAGPLAGVHTALSTSVLVHSGSGWQVASTQNTLVGSR